MNQDNTDITVNLQNSYSPYEDKSLREIQPDSPVLNQREPFNDYIKHGDIITGYQRNRTLSDYPRSTRHFVKLNAIIMLVLILAGALWDILSMLR